MNRYQAAFLASLLLSFSSLVLISHYINKKLVAAGYDFSQLILLGLPKTTEPQTDRVTMADIKNVQHAAASLVNNFTLDDLKAVQVPYIGTLNLFGILTSPAVIVTTILVLGAAFYVKVMRKRPIKVLNPTEWQEFPLEKKIQVSHNTAMYRFTLPHPQALLGLPIGQHISVTAEINGKKVLRSYTPISHESDRGFFDLMIKTYEQGNISKHMSLLKLGDKLRVRGPKGNFRYTPGMNEHISMIAGGSGITPMLQIIRAILLNPSDKTTVSLIYANVNEDDILLRNDIEQYLQAYQTRLKVYFVLNNPPPGWQGGVGFVTKEHIKEHLPNPATSNSRLLMCGPPPMITAMKKNLGELDYPAPRTVSKLADPVFVF